MGVCTGGARAGPGIVKALSLRDTPLPGSSMSNRWDFLYTAATEPVERDRQHDDDALVLEGYFLKVW